ncbi:uncharacterized protein LOC134667744 [Cydia fagiglandana]|uniref:uncharacterized protein LOC134667744 n=1 Tax=Cydia fagiglandana TaxID=1458189 RepID=UPI002FEE0F38
MKVGILVVLVCVVGAESNFLDDLVVHLENAWIGFKNFIKRPPRSKRIHEHGSTTASTSTTFGWFSTSTSTVLTKTTTYQTELPQIVETRSIPTTTPAMTEIITAQNTMPPDMLYYFQRPKHKQVLLPFFPTPKWRTRDHWNWNRIQQQNSDFLFWRDESLGGRAERGFAGDDDVTTAQQLNQPTDEGIGVMMFI